MKTVGVFSIGLVVLAASAVALACATPTAQKPTSPKKWKAYFAAHKTVGPGLVRDLAAAASQSLLPSVKSNPWGGIDATLWKPEAIFANAASEALNDAWAEANVRDVLVAVPLKMEDSTERPYGDGQTNSSINFGTGWKSSRPPLVVTLIQFKNGMTRLKFHVEGSLLKEAATLRLVYHFNGAPTSKNWSATEPRADGDYEFVWAPSQQEAPKWGGLFQNHVAFVQLGKSKDWYPIDFRDVVISVHEMLEQVPESQRKLGKGSLLDPELVTVQPPMPMAGDEPVVAAPIDPSAFPFLAMASESFGKDINADRYFPVSGSGIHNEFPLAAGARRITAVGHGNTLVMLKPPSPFKLAYICFDRRDAEAEAAAGVPSGGGWHQIGDPAETVLNTLETDSLLVAYANGQPVANTPSGGFAQGLTDIAVVRKLKPGSALITAAGRNYHWFAFHQSHEVCAVEWVHPEIPSETNHLGFSSMWK